VVTGNPAPQPAVISPRSSDLFARLLASPLRRHVSPWSGVPANVAAEVWADFDELRRAGDEWRAGRISVDVRPVTEMAARLSQEISSKEAAELLKRTDSRVRQLLRTGELQGRRDGRRWVIQGSTVEAYRNGSGKVAA
jgi:excisionase family DNA binding protein